MLDQKLARVRELLRKRDEIDAELDAMLQGADAPRRGRPRKEQGNSREQAPTQQPTEPGAAVAGRAERVVE